MSKKVKRQGPPQNQRRGGSTDKWWGEMKEEKTSKRICSGSEGEFVLQVPHERTLI